ncbi:MAG: glycosyltransferase [Candidatus Desulfacyla sp.]
MKILQVSTYDISGGAARAAYRLQKGLREMGHDSRMLVRHKNTKSVYVHSVYVETGIEEARGGFFLENVIQQHYITRHRTERSNTLFSFPYPGYDIARIPALNEADVINLHWVAQYQSPVTLRNLSSLGKPVVWTLHDQWAFTGGCHYSAGCENYQADCTRCPQVTEDLWSLPAAVLKDKLDLFKGISFTLVTPSRWMADCIRKSRLFGAQRVEVIPNSLETDIFAPLPKETAKESFGLEKDTLTILFGGEDANERRKGFGEMVLAIDYLTEKDEFKALLETKRVCMLCFGRPKEAFNSMNIQVISLGYLGSDVEIRNAYCAADVFVLPSLEDNLPNTVLEAMSCGTPVVGFEIGGMPDMVENGVTGQLVPPGDTVQLGEAILSLLLNSRKRHEMGERCRHKIETEYDLSVQASRYVALYEELLSEKSVEPLEGLGENHEHSFAFFGEDLSVSAPLEPAVGTHFEKVYDTVLFRALKESTFEIYRNWQDAELDRVRRLQVIREQGERITDLEFQVDRWLNEAKRLQDVMLQRELEAKNPHEEVTLLENRILDIEADRIARLNVINDQGERISELEAEVDRWLNESRRLHEACAELERDRNELKRKTMLQGGIPLLQWMRRDRSFLSDRLREALLILKGTKGKRFDPAVAVKKILRSDGVRASDSERNTTNQIPLRDELAVFKNRIDAFNASQPNRKMLDDIRLFNHSMIDQFNSLFPLKGCILLDVGASPHGYALERALTYGAALYAGIGLDIDDGEYISGDGNSVGLLLKMDAANLRFPDGMFDAVFSISVFEHVSDVLRVLSEIARVLRVGGCALISFEPVWSCSYGHHLHHFGECARLVPAWGHLIWSPDQMRDYLSDRWPGNAPLLLDEAIEWIYHGDSINRLNIRQFKELFEKSGLTARWCKDLPDDEKNCNSVQLKMASEATGLAPDELMTKGLCMLLTKESSRT